ncbi:MAG: rhomboid family intramembrane serine protease [Gemmatimonadota bacterium]|nr:rhomboid family intramembrane serine protease [Gemmatimonadota bacterium]
MAYAPRGFGFGHTLTPMVKRLLIANVVVFFLTVVFGQGVMQEWFAFRPTRVFVQPWGVVTYMFLHANFGHLFWNMLGVFFFGPPLEANWGSREFLKYYLICGIGGVALSYVFLPAAVVGASAAMYGLLLAFALNWPNAPIYIWGIFPIQAKWIVGGLFLMSLGNALGDKTSAIAHFAHLGGFVTGFLYLKSDWRPAAAMRRARRAARRMVIVPSQRSEVKEAEGPPEPARRQGEGALYDAVDRVLDKISAEGMSSLTPDELRLLDEVSRRRRSN